MPAVHSKANAAATTEFGNRRPVRGLEAGMNTKTRISVELTVLAAVALAGFAACRTDTSSAGSLVVIAPASPAPTAPDAPPEFRLFKSPDGSYTLSVPAVWKEDAGEGSQVLFDGTTHEGDFAFGDTLLVTHLVARETDARTYDENCGKHICSATLTVVHGGTLQLKFRHEWAPGDPDAPGPGDAKSKLGKLADRVMKPS
jgi:hypothetical protein